MSWAVAGVVAGGTLAAVGAVKQGSANRRAYELQAEAAKLEADQARIDAEIAAVEGLRQEVSRKRELTIIQATNLASVSYDAFAAPSFLAIQAANQREAEKDVRYIRFNTINQRLASIIRAQQGFMASRELEGAGETAFETGIIKAGRSIFSSVAQGAQIR